MSTTVTYKGDTIATVDNATKTLKTAGKYLEDDITLSDISESQGIVITDVLDEHGGTIRHINGMVISGTKTITENGTGIDVSAYSNVDVNVPFDPLGKNLEFVKSLCNDSYALEDTDYASWTPSTTASAIVASKTLSPTYAGDTANYEYYLHWKFDAVVNYAAGTTKKYATDREIVEMWQLLSKRPSSRVNIEANNFNGNYCLTYLSPGFTSYYDKNGTRTYTWSASYGLYIGATAATFSNSTTDTPTITIKTPAINARCSGSYFSTAMAAAVDQENSTVKLVGEMYRVKANTSPMKKMFERIVNIYNNPL